MGAAVAILLVWASQVAAHGTAISEFRLRVRETRVEGEWDVPLHDARVALGLDPRIDGEDGWLDLRAHEDALRTYLGAHLAVSADGRDCFVSGNDEPIRWQREAGQVSVALAAACPSRPAHLGLRCDVLFDRDPAHRAYFSIEDARTTHVGVFTAERRSASVDVRDFSLGAGFAEFVREGMAHIFSGVDHLLFLLALLLPASLVRTGEEWKPRGSLAATTREVLKVVTAFTVAHSVTLCLSFFGVLAPPARWVEVAIAVSVLAAAWNNLRPFLPGRAWTMAMAFGLVHGLGFAGALKNLALPIHARGVALAAFNIGVELGQLVVVAAVLPLLYAASSRRWYPRLVMGAGSLVIAWLAVIWVLERGLGLSLLGV
jgi:HupE / UreJ protein